MLHLLSRATRLRSFVPSRLSSTTSSPPKGKNRNTLLWLAGGSNKTLNPFYLSSSATSQSSPLPAVQELGCLYWAPRMHPFPCKRVASLQKHHTATLLLRFNLRLQRVSSSPSQLSNVLPEDGIRRRSQNRKHRLQVRPFNTVFRF